MLPGKGIKITAMSARILDDFGSATVYHLDGCKYKFGFGVKTLAGLMGINLRTFRAYISGKRSYFPRKFIKDYKGLDCWKDKGRVIVIKDVEVSVADAMKKVKEDVVPFESVLNILKAYSVNDQNGGTKSSQRKVAEIAQDLYDVIFGVWKVLAREVNHRTKEEKGVPITLDLAFEQTFDDKLFQVEYPLLREVIEAAYPERPEWKYSALTVTVFKYAYEDILGTYAYNELKAKRMYLAPLHQHINDPLICQKLKAYITAYAVLMCHMEKDGSNAASKLTKTKNVRLATIAALKSHYILARDIERV